MRAFPFKVMIGAAAMAAWAATVGVARPVQGDDVHREGHGRVIAVGAQRSVRIPASHARLAIAVEAQAETAAAAQDAVAQASRALRDLLKREPVKKLQAGELVLDPVFEVPSASRHGTNARIVGYRASWSASFEVPAEAAGAMANEVVGAGATRVARFEFVAGEEAMAEAERQALEAAAREARRRGEAVLTALGYEMKEVVEITILGGAPVASLQRNRTLELMSTGAADTGPTAVEAGMVEVEASVSLRIAY